MSSMRCRATRAEAAVASSTVMRLTTSPATRCSSTQHRWAASIRNIVEHGQISGSSDTHGLVRVLGGQPLHQVDLGGDADGGPGGAASTALMMKSVDPTWSARSTTSWAHSGWTTTMPSGWLCPEGGDVRGPEALVDRAVALPQQEAWPP